MKSWLAAGKKELCAHLAFITPPTTLFDVLFTRDRVLHFISTGSYLL